MSSPDLRNVASDLYRSARRSPWVRAWARFGFVTGGIMYVIIGVLAASVALEGRGRVVGPEGALERIAEEPYGRIVLLAAAVGLCGYAIWRFVQGTFDTDRDGTGFGGWAARIGVFCTGVGYGTLAVFAFHRALGSARPQDNAPHHWTAVLLAHRWGAAVIVVAGLVLIGASIAEAVYAAREKFRQQLKTWQIDASDLGWIVQCGKIGYLAQALVIGLVGALLVVAGAHADPNSARGLDGALRALARQEYGPWLLGTVAAGLVAYGIFMLILARYRKLS